MTYLVDALFQSIGMIIKTLDRPKKIIAYHNSMAYDFSKKPSIVSLTLQGTVVIAFNTGFKIENLYVLTT
jgi:hypothetical protein